MRLSLWILGNEVLAIDTGRTEQSTDNGERTSYPISFSPSYGDARWEPGIGLEEP